MSVRVIAGISKGKRLKSVPGLKTRPTADRVREAIFNIISFQLQDAVVLDLFAGTGAFGIEALSRGAAFSVFIDNDRFVLGMIEKNLQACYMEARSKVIGWNILKNLDCIRSTDPPFGLIFMDPPYGCNYVEKTLINLHASGALAHEAQIIIEHDHTELFSSIGSEFHIYDHRKYGRAMISFLHYTGK